MQQESLERAMAFVESARVSAISTVTSNDGPHVTVMHHSCLRSPFRIIYSADKGSTKYANVLVNSKSAVVVGWSEQDWITVQLRGTTTAVTDPDELILAKIRHYAIHPNSRKFEHDPSTVFLKFEPSWIRYSDLGVAPPVIEEAQVRF